MCVGHVLARAEDIVCPAYVFSCVVRAHTQIKRCQVSGRRTVMQPALMESVLYARFFDVRVCSLRTAFSYVCVCVCVIRSDLM